MRRMGEVRMVPVRANPRKRFQPPHVSADEEMETDFFFMRGAAVMGIGVIVALVVVAYVMLMIFTGRAHGQATSAGQQYFGAHRADCQCTTHDLPVETG